MSRCTNLGATSAQNTPHSSIRDPYAILVYGVVVRTNKIISVKKVDDLYVHPNICGKIAHRKGGEIAH